MYGPGPDPRQVLAPILVYDDPWPYLLCLGLGLGLSALALWRRPPEALRYLALITGQVILLTAPLFWHLDRYVYGSFPTIDKEGSLLFYLDGVHLRMLAHPLLSPADAAARLIGVHVGHLWLSQLFDLFLSPIGAFNAQAFLYLVLGWWCAWLLLREVCGEGRVAFVLSFAFGMGLHVFRDLNWYTIEKAAIFWLPLYLWALYRAWQRGGAWRSLPGLVILGMAWTNLYLALAAALFMAITVVGVAAGALRARAFRLGLRNTLHAAAVSALALSPLALWQWALMQGGPQLGTPEQFLWERAALDGFSLVPFRWNRLEPHRALNMVGVGLALFGAVRLRRDPRVQLALFAGTLLFALSIGPILLPSGPVLNPVYMLARTLIPGFWRVAKPEVFFHVSWLLMLCVAAVELVSFTTSRRGIGALYALFVVAWLLMVRSHPAYPPMTLPVESRLSPHWADEVFPPTP